MASLKDLRNRIDSVKNTQKITKAMQMVAAAKLRRAQEAAEAARPYSERMEAVLTNLGAGMVGKPGAPELLAGNGKDDTHLLVVATGERGLCGGFNSSIARLARGHARGLIADGKTVKMLFVGRKGHEVLKREFNSHVIELIEFGDVKNIEFSHADGVGQKIIQLFEDGVFDVCTAFYSLFESVMTQVPTVQQIIPAKIEVQEGAAASAEVYDYEPDETEILNMLLPRNVSIQIFKAMLENAASEQGARTTAMDNATRNAGEMIDKLTITYNRSRQAQITTELIEIIAGAEAL